MLRYQGEGDKTIWPINAEEDVAYEWTNGIYKNDSKNFRFVEEPIMPHAITRYHEILRAFYKDPSSLGGKLPFDATVDSWMGAVESATVKAAPAKTTPVETAPVETAHTIANKKPETPKIETVRHLATVKAGWKLMSIQDVRDNFEEIKKSMTHWGIYRLADGKVAGRGYRYEI